MSTLAPLCTFVKDPNATLDFDVDWTLWLNGDTIVASSWTVPAGLTTPFADTFTAAGIAKVWLGGGTVDSAYACVNHITTAGGRQDDRTLTIRVQDK